MIVLFTDFGWQGPYVGQMKAVLHQHAPEQAIVDLAHDAPVFDPRAAAYLLAAWCRGFASGSVFVCVVDPGVGTGQRRPVLLRADDYWFVGPDNGLFNRLAMDARELQMWEILWRPAQLSCSFHGRDLFAPVAAQLATGTLPEARQLPVEQLRECGWPRDDYRCLYSDAFGNIITGVEAAAVDPDALVALHGQRIPHGHTFGDVRQGSAFWYENSSGLLEVSVNRGNAARELRVAPGDEITIVGQGAD